MPYLSNIVQFQKSLNEHLINIVQMTQANPRSIDYWFPTAIYKEILSDFSQHNGHLKNKALTLKKSQQNHQVTQWRCDTFNTLGTYDPGQDHDSVVKELIKTIKVKVYEFSRQFGVTTPIESLVLKDFWFNVSGTGSYQEYHQHALSHFSVVYYVSAPKTCGNIVFQSAETITDMFTLPIENNKFTELSFKTCSYEPLESMMLIFKSNLIHMVEKNLSNEDRISIAMNFKFEGQ